jgi:hypothetical protein
VPASTAVSVQVFGFESDQPTRAAIRFFKERRVAIHLVDLRRKPIAASCALHRAPGARALLDETSRATARPGSPTCAWTMPGSSSG